MTLAKAFGRYTIGNDEKIIPLVSSANIACGYHASDPVVMQEAIARSAKEARHSRSAPIRDFRISWDLAAELWQSPRRRQRLTPCIRSVPSAACVRQTGCACSTSNHTEPLYNMAAKDYELSLAICEAIRDLMTLRSSSSDLSGSETIRAARDCGLKAASEVFADRGLRGRRHTGQPP